MTRLMRGIGFVVLLFGAACDTGPEAGELVFALSTPNADDGAVQFTLTAVAPNTIDGVAAACAGCQVFVETVREAEVRGVLVGEIMAGAALRVTVSDRKSPDMYAASVVAVASRTFALQNAGAYSLTVGDR